MDKNKRNYFVKQKLFGLFTIIMSLCSVPMVKDATWALIGVPLGTYLIFTKERIFMPWYFEEDENEES